ncbi:MAG: YlbF family regulator [Clostridia bacterium]|nr:YlbF family regulator [Clostridia bacterium]
MDILLEKAIELANLLKEDDRCKAILAAQQAADADETLQALIGDFNMKRIAINTEETKENGEQDADKLRELNTELRSIYASIMANEHMMAYNQAKEALDGIVNKMHIALNLAAAGQDPAIAAQEGGCSGDCGSCGGCH